MPLDGVSAHTNIEYDQYSSQKDGSNRCVAQESDRAMSDSFKCVHVACVASVLLEPLLVSQALKAVSELPGISSDPVSPESASTVVDRNRRSSKGFIPELNQSLNATGKADNILYMETFTGGCAGNENEMKGLCIALVMLIGLWVAALVM